MVQVYRTKCGNNKEKELPYCPASFLGLYVTCQMIGDAHGDTVISSRSIFDSRRKKNLEIEKKV
jgi:hypothetical protein